MDQPIRVYDARFKIPAQSNIGQLMSAKNSSELTKGQTSKEYRSMVKALERYKKFVSVTAILLMALAMLYNIGVYGILIRDLQKERYYLARTRYNVTQEIDFEELTVTEIKYFLYRNKTEEPQDAGDEDNSLIVTDLEGICEFDGFYLDSDSNMLL